MNKGKLLFVPSGGLANRMRAMASAWQMAQHTGVNCLRLTAPENATCAFRCYFSDFILRNA